MTVLITYAIPISTNPALINPGISKYSTQGIRINRSVSSPSKYVLLYFILKNAKFFSLKSYLPRTEQATYVARVLLVQITDIDLPHYLGHSVKLGSIFEYMIISLKLTSSSSATLRFFYCFIPQGGVPPLAVIPACLLWGFWRTACRHTGSPGLSGKLASG